MKITLGITVEKNGEQISRKMDINAPDDLEDIKTMTLKTVLIPFAKLVKNLIDNIDAIMEDLKEKEIHKMQSTSKRKKGRPKKKS